jgi:hypothetical protein
MGYTAQTRKNYLAHRKLAHRLFILEYLETHPCVDCGQTDPFVLEFDHVRGTKKTTISALLSQCAALKIIIDEIEKCDVRCANCHKRRTAAAQGWYTSLCVNSL